MKTDVNSLVFVKDFFKERFNIEITWNSDQYSRADGYFNWNGVDYLIEVKRRRFNRSKYPTTIVNRDKFEFLGRNHSILVVIFDDGLWICKDVKKAFVKDDLKWGRHTTDFGGNYEYSLKTELSLKKGEWYDVDTTFSKYDKQRNSN